MYSTTKIFEDLIKNGNFSNMSNEDIQKTCKNEETRIFKELAALKIPGVPDSVYESIVRYALEQEYDEDEFMNLIEVKISRHFFNK